MITTIDKAIAAILPGIILWVNQKWGFHFDTTPETMAIFAGLIGSILTYLVPNIQNTPAA